MPKTKSRKGKFTSVSIPIPLFRKIEVHIEDTGFTSVSSYVTYILREIVAESASDTSETSAKADQEKVKERLRALGYLD
ncbi:MAG: CopG family transcriptional regulator [Candidatus Lokiarchaeota archaeon]|nr:CopG family transcriptional regulator [Candidatus Lokiarchaeota archaeon]